MKGFPRVRGDVPPLSVSVSAISTFSPRARGCSQRDQLIQQAVSVFPACAGMFLIFKIAPWIGASFPRVRGDVPRVARGVLG